MCGHCEDAEEVAQETLLKKSGVYRIAKNECFMKRRKSVFALKVELSLDQLKPARPGDGESGGMEIADWTSLPDDLVLAAELQEALTRAIRELPDIHRTVVLLRDVEELTADQAAEVPEKLACTVDHHPRTRTWEDMRHER